MWRRSVGVGVSLLALGCAETATSTRASGSDAGTSDLGQPAFLPPTDQCSAESPLAGPCGGSQVTAPMAVNVEALLQAVRANADDTAVFWMGPFDRADSGVMMQRVGPLGDWVDAQPIELVSTARDRLGRVATAWDHDACEPVVLVGEGPGALTLHSGGLHVPSVARPIVLPETDAALVLDGAGGLRAVDGGWAFFLTSLNPLATVVEVVISAQGEVRSTRALAANAPVPYGAFGSAALLDQSFFLLLYGAGTTTGTLDFQRVDRRGEFSGPVGTWRATGEILSPPIAAIATGYLIGWDVGAGAASLAAFDQSPAADSGDREAGVGRRA